MDHIFILEEGVIKIDQPYKLEENGRLKELFELHTSKTISKKTEMENYLNEK
ncbi:hypothetical protein [Spiroplasma floricola]|uniref:Uncharacterized protein n=1 Tax=Spiroplasma floricola 23-6 TaxID=1336749 RepID=A0A2K8SDM5_9MOLU|nr:hypothetical protein [Spiroplasma floricola]AUB31567.1 hypothetical protein SFLOR_v1c05150 [Spiroplasma floricola 23-6]